MSAWGGCHGNLGCVGTGSGDDHSALISLQFLDLYSRRLWRFRSYLLPVPTWCGPLSPGDRALRRKKMCLFVQGEVVGPQARV